MEPERHRIQKQFDQLRSILDKEEQRQLKKLEEEERRGLNIIAEAEVELVQQSQSLRELISDLERRCEGSATELLQVRMGKGPLIWESRPREDNSPSPLMWDSYPGTGKKEKKKTLLWENSIETCILSSVKQIASPGWMHETSAQGWCTGKTQRDGMGREVGGGIRMGNTCKSMADSCQCMTKTTTIL